MAAGDGAPLPGTMVPASRNVEKALEEAAASGALHLANRKLKEFPKSAKNYDLSDITHADLSRNRLCELPEELCQFISLETLILYHNGMRSLSSGICNLQALTYLNISRNLLCSLPPSVFELPLLRVLIVSNNKLCSLPSSIYTLTHLRQLDLSCNELQTLPVELSQLECLRDLNLRRNRLTTLPEEMSELPLVRLDVSCNRISRVPLCFRHLRSLQSLSLDNNPLQTPPAHVCSRGKYHIFKYLNMEACRGSSSQELERHLRPSDFTSCLSEQELFSGPLGGLDSGFNSVDSGSKRWSGNESADDFSERSREREQRSLEEGQDDASPTASKKFFAVNGEAEHLDFLDSSLAEEEEEEDSSFRSLGAPYLAGDEMTSFPALQSQNATELRPDLQEKSPSSPSSASSPSSPTLEGRRRPETLLIWQERERLQQQQRDKATLPKSSTKAASHSATTPRTEISSPAADVEPLLCSPSLGGSCSMSASCSSASPHRSSSRADTSSSLKTSPPAGKVQKPNSFLFRTSSQSSGRPTGSSWSLGQSGRSESRTTLRSPKEERADVVQLRKTLESRLKVSLPEDLGEALSNGTVLCQLVNQIRPRSVSIIHIPSPAVPKLSSAKCRLNVENFIAACRKLGLPETDLCVCSDVLLCRLPALSRCVAALLALRGGREEQQEEQEESGEPEQQRPSAPSLLSTDFLLFYCAAMALLYVLYCHVLT